MDGADAAEDDDGVDILDGAGILDGPFTDPSAYSVNGAVLALLRPEPAVGARAENIVASMLEGVAAFLYVHEAIAAQHACRQWRAGLQTAPAHGLFYCAAAAALPAAAAAMAPAHQTRRLLSGGPLRVASLLSALRARPLLSVQVVRSASSTGQPLRRPHPYDGEEDGTGAPTDAEVREVLAKAQATFDGWAAWSAERGRSASAEEKKDSKEQEPQATERARVAGTVPAAGHSPDAVGEWKRRSVPAPGEWECRRVPVHASRMWSLQVDCDCKSSSAALCCQQVVFSVLRVRAAAAPPLSCRLAFRQCRHDIEEAPVVAIHQLAAPWTTTLFYARTSAYLWQNSDVLLRRVRVLSMDNPTFEHAQALAVRLPLVTTLELRSVPTPIRPWLLMRSTDALSWRHLRKVVCCTNSCAGCAAAAKPRLLQSQRERVQELQALIDRGAAPQPTATLHCEACATDAAPARAPRISHSPRRNPARCASCGSANPAATCRNAPYCAVARLFHAFPADPAAAVPPLLRAVDTPLRFEVSFGRPTPRPLARVFGRRGGGDLPAPVSGDRPAPAFGDAAGPPADPLELRWEVAVSMEVAAPAPFNHGAPASGSLSLAETVLELAHARFDRGVVGVTHIGTLLDTCAKALADIESATRLGLEIAVEWAPPPSPPPSPSPHYRPLNHAGAADVAPPAASPSHSPGLSGRRLKIAPRCVFRVYVSGSDRAARTNARVAELCSTVLHVFRTTAAKAGHDF